MVLDFERKTKGPFRGNCHPSVLILTNRYFQITSTELIWRKDKNVILRPILLPLVLMFGEQEFLTKTNVQSVLLSFNGPPISRKKNEKNLINRFQEIGKRAISGSIFP